MVPQSISRARDQITEIVDSAKDKKKLIKYMSLSHRKLIIKIFSDQESGETIKKEKIEELKNRISAIKDNKIKFLEKILYKIKNIFYNIFYKGVTKDALKVFATGSNHKGNSNKETKVLESDQGSSEKEVIIASDDETEITIPDPEENIEEETEITIPDPEENIEEETEITIPDPEENIERETVITIRSPENSRSNQGPESNLVPNSADTPRRELTIFDDEGFENSLKVICETMKRQTPPRPPQSRPRIHDDGYSKEMNFSNTYQDKIQLLEKENSSLYKKYLEKWIKNDQAWLNSAQLAKLEDVLPSDQRNEVYIASYPISLSRNRSDELPSNTIQKIKNGKYTEVLVPINIDNSHWILGRFNTEDHTVTLYDSMAGNHEHVRSKIEQLAVEIFDYSSTNVTIEEGITSELQNDAYQCGVWVYHIAKCIINQKPILQDIENVNKENIKTYMENERKMFFHSLIDVCYEEHCQVKNENATLGGRIVVIEEY